MSNTQKSENNTLFLDAKRQKLNDDMDIALILINMETYSKLPLKKCEPIEILPKFPKSPSEKQTAIEHQPQTSPLSPNFLQFQLLKTFYPIQAEQIFKSNISFDSIKSINILNAFKVLENKNASLIVNNTEGIIDIITNDKYEKIYSFVKPFYKHGRALNPTCYNNTFCYITNNSNQDDVEKFMSTNLIALALLKETMKTSDPKTYINIVNINECFTITNNKYIDFLITFNFSRKSQLDPLYYNQLRLDAIIKNGLTELFALSLISQIIQGVDFCHSAQLSILNINVFNIKIFNKNNIYNAVIGDLSQLQCIPKPSDEPIVISCMNIITCYSPPEVIKKKPFNGFAVDMWSIGVIFYIMLKGIKAWDNIVINNEYNIKSHQMFIDKITYDNSISINSRIILQILLDYDPAKRGNAKYIMSKINIAQGII